EQHPLAVALDAHLLAELDAGVDRPRGLARGRILDASGVVHAARAVAAELEVAPHAGVVGAERPRELGRGIRRRREASAAERLAAERDVDRSIDRHRLERVRIVSERRRAEHVLLCVTPAVARAAGPRYRAREIGCEIGQTELLP